MYARCTKCHWKTFISEGDKVRKQCPKCKSKVEVAKG